DAGDRFHPDRRRCPRPSHRGGPRPAPPTDAGAGRGRAAQAGNWIRHAVRRCDLARRGGGRGSDSSLARHSRGGATGDPGAAGHYRGEPAAAAGPGSRRAARRGPAQRRGADRRWRPAAWHRRRPGRPRRHPGAGGARPAELRGRGDGDGARQSAGDSTGAALHHMSTEARPASQVAILLGGGVREALMAQPLLRACEGATVFSSGDGVGTLLGLPSVGRAFVFDDSPGELLRVFRRLRGGSIGTVVVPFPARFLHLALTYFAGVPRRLMVAGANDWAATERLTAVRGMHPVEANWRLAAAAGNRPVLAPGDAPTLHPPEPVRAKAIARWPAFIGGGRRPLVLIPGGGGWSSGRSGHSW